MSVKSWSQQRFGAPLGKPPGYPVGKGGKADEARWDQVMEYGLAAHAITGAAPAWIVDWAAENLTKPNDPLDPFHRGMNTLHLPLALGAVLGRPGYADALEAFYRDQRAPGYHGWHSEGLSRGYAGKSWVSAAAAYLSGLSVAGDYLRDRLTVDALMCTPVGRVIAPCGRYVKPLEVGAWIIRGSINAATDYALARTLYLDARESAVAWHTRQALPAWVWRERGADLRAIYSDAERDALRAWILVREIRPELRALLAPVRLVQRLHVVAGAPGQHVAWMEDIHSYTGNGVQPTVWTDGGVDRFVVAVKAPAAVERFSDTLRITAAGSTFEATMPPWVSGAVEIVIGDQASIGGATVPPVTPPPSLPIPAPQQPAPAAAEVEALLADLRRIRGARNLIDQVRAHFLRPDASPVRVAMGRAVLAVLGE